MQRTDEFHKDTTTLITVNTNGIVSHGTGIVVASDETASWLLTCAHVVPDDRCEITVNAVKADEVVRASAIGLDLALVKIAVPSMRPVKIGNFSEIERKPGASGLRYFGYGQLHGPYYVLDTIDYSLANPAKLQHGGAALGFGAHYFKCARGQLQPGHSGSALLNANGQACAVVSFRINGEAEKDHDLGLALSLADAEREWTPLGKLLGVVTETGTSNQSAPITRAPRHKVDPDDPNKRQFGGKSKREEFQLSGELLESSVREKYFIFDLIVKRSPQGRAVEKVIFHLHSSYPRSKIRVTKDYGNCFLLREVWASGTYTVGCEVHLDDGNVVELEYDISKLLGLPKYFIGR